MDYNESMDYLKGMTKFGMNFGLERIKNLLFRLGNPEKDLTCIHVGGTNGKGSVCAFLSSILHCSGMKVGLFTSPHLHSYTERIRINGGDIKEDDIGILIGEIRVHLDAMILEGIEHPTEFEVTTALALLYFARQKVDIAIIEVGLGGAIDSTNVINPKMSIITNIGMDHMDYLGPSIVDIARVKSGIIKRKRDVITAVDEPDALDVIREKVKEEEATIWEYNKDIVAEPISSTEEGQIFNSWVLDTLLPDLKISLRGRHQMINASLAVAAAVKLGVEVSVVKEGLEKAIWPCRLETVSHDPLVVIDAAHNYHGIKVLVQALKEYWPDRKKILMLGMLADKEREKVAGEIAPLAEKIVITKPNSPRAGKWEQVAEFVKPYVREVIVEENISQAVDKALKLAEHGEMLIITGSIYMVSEARAHLLQLVNK